VVQHVGQRRGGMREKETKEVRRERDEENE